MQAGFLNFYDGVLSVAQDRAGLITNNIANADTPGFKARDVDFDALLAAQLGPTESDGGGAALYRASATVGLNGNDVSLDSERVEAAQNGEQMEEAATFLHQSTADLITALRPNPSGN
jgi:flagellar basal-body rod protein FlgB